MAEAGYLTTDGIETITERAGLSPRRDLAKAHRIAANELHAAIERARVGRPFARVLNSLGIPQVGEATAAALGETWMRTILEQNDVDILGATAASYSIPAVNLGDAGDFKVVVTNLYGMKTSSVATLTVTLFSLACTACAAASFCSSSLGSML